MKAVVILLLAISCGTIPASAAHMYYGTPTVDGVDSNEWSAARVGTVVFQGPSDFLTADFFFMNDETNFYEAIRVSLAALPFEPDTSGFGSWNWPAVLEFCDGSTVSDFLSLAARDEKGGPVFLADDYFVPGDTCQRDSDVEAGGTNDIIGARSDEGSTHFFELVHPLNSVDNLHDVSMAAPDLMRVAFFALVVGQGTPYQGTLQATIRLAGPDLVFSDDFELEDMSRWTFVIP